MNPRIIRDVSRRMAHLVFLVVLVVAAHVPPGIADAAVYNGQAAKNILFFIGDGMGQAQRMAAEQYSGSPLAMNRMQHQGITTTHAANRFITGSAAAATALASGQKTQIGMIGLSPSGQRVKSIAEMARARGMKVGIVTSVSIDHATPAAFFAHVDTRHQYYDIAVALGKSGFDFFGGGGLSDPTNRKHNARHYAGDALKLIRDAGYTVVRDKDTFMALEPGPAKVMVINPRLPDGHALPYAIDRRAEDISLPELTAKAIQLLDNPNGFFLMVEGGKIDWACHANDAATMIHDTLDFDRAVGVGVTFAHSHSQDTLVVVTGDHECGGLTLGWAETEYFTDFSILRSQTISFQQFTDAVLKPFKANCAADCGFDTIQPIISKYFGLRFVGDPNTDPMVPETHQFRRLEAAFDLSMGRLKDPSTGPAARLSYGNYDPLTVALTHTLNNMAGLGWTSFKHTGIAVTTSALGVGAETFNGYYDNTDIAKKIMAAMGLDARVHVASRSAAVRWVAAQ